MEVISLYVTQPKRIRVVYSGPINSGFLVTSLYSVVSNDSTGYTPNILAVYAVAGNSNIVELVLSIELVGGGNYTVTSTGYGSLNLVYHVATTPLPNTESLVSNRDEILYKRDLVWTGDDFGVTPEGDAATIAGTKNVEEAIMRRCLGSPLPYAPGYSPNSREFVDSNDSTPLGPRLKQQCLRDSRVKSVKVVPKVDSDNVTTFQIFPTLIGDENIDPISMTVNR